MTDDDSDAMLDRLDRGEPAASKEEAEAREPYEQLISRIRDLPDEAPPDGWESRLEQRRHRELSAAKGTRRTRRLGAGILGAVAAAAALIASLVMFCRVPVAALEPIAYDLKPAERSKRRGGDVFVGDGIAVTGHGTRSVQHLRLYRDGTLVASCPGSADSKDCKVTGKKLEVDWVFDSPGKYVLLLIDGDQQPSASEGLDMDRVKLRHIGFVVTENALPSRVLD